MNLSVMQSQRHLPVTGKSAFIVGMVRRRIKKKKVGYVFIAFDKFSKGTYNILQKTSPDSPPTG